MASPSPQNAAQTLVSIASTEHGNHELTAESIAPWNVLTLFVDDFFTYMHPLTPFPHEPTFREAFMNREDKRDPLFLALLASMVGFLVASFPRSARAQLKAQHSTDLFPRAITLIDHCRSIALEARGAKFEGREEMTVYDAATSYFLGLAAGYTFQWRVCRRFLTQSLSFIQELELHKPRQEGQTPINHIEDQMGKRIFWVIFMGVRYDSGLIVTQKPMPVLR